MGMCLDDFGKISIEVRRESFIIHPDDDVIWPKDLPHPEIALTELDNLIAALQDAKRYLKEHPR